MSERDTDVVGNPTMQITKTAKEVKPKFQRQDIVARQARFGSRSAPGIGKQSHGPEMHKWPKDELGNPTRQVGDIK